MSGNETTAILGILKGYELWDFGRQMINTK
jgi:hypothetical protein